VTKERSFLTGVPLSKADFALFINDLCKFGPEVVKKRQFQPPNNDAFSYRHPVLEPGMDTDSFQHKGAKGAKGAPVSGPAWEFSKGR
jgi:hypothetical protein